MAVREALVVATSSYEDSRLNQLNSPGLDAMELSEVLSDPAIGGYAVRPVIDQPAHVVRREIERFFIRRKPDDQLLLYLSCHGIKDSRLQLYFAAADTDRDLLESTAVPAGFVNGRLVNCNSRKILVLLDCCYSGAFKPGGAKSADTAVHLLEEFKDTGVAVITATDALQQAWEGEGPVTETGEGQLSVFTAAAVEGLRSGRADRDGDGWVSVEDLYGHVRAEMQARDARQSPLRWILGGQGTLKIARRAAPEGTGPLTLPRPRSVPSLVGPATELLAGITPAATLLRRTLGPSPRPVLLKRADGMPYTSTDTLEIVGELPTEPGYAAMGTGLLQDLVADQYRRARDGTATAAVVFEAVVRGLQPALAQGTHPAVLARAVRPAFAQARRILKGFAVPLQQDWVRLGQAMTTVCGDEQVAAHVGDALRGVGEKGAVTVSDSSGFGLSAQMSEGCVLQAGFLSPHFSTDDANGEAVLENPHVLLCAEPLVTVEDVLPALERVLESGRPLLVVAPAVEGEVLPTLAVNAERNIFRSIAVAVPATDPPFGRLLLGDLAVVTGGVVFERSADLRDAQREQLGGAGRVVSTRTTTLLIRGEGEASRITEHLVRLVRDSTRAGASAPSGFDTRMALLTTKIVEIGVGGAGDEEIRQRKTRVRQAVHAGRAALGHGVIPGASTTLATVGVALGSPPVQAAGDAVAALGRALAEPLLAVATNHGEPDPDQLLQRVDAQRPTAAYDATEGGFSDVEAAGLWEPVTTAWSMLHAVEAAVLEYLSVI
ncbi:TCP-1/cpn60 chaperonin family protein [Streptomyces sp. NPDC059989]|uniref:caspase, EACC1-associated type n=1 Tax=Streptomyces sp. NPDC059989 TaxID=3347026 RepID=UPI0036737160